MWCGVLKCGHGALQSVYDIIYIVGVMSYIQRVLYFESVGVMTHIQGL